MTLEERLLHSPAWKGWQRVGARQHHGICVPLFSLRSNSSCGIGEYSDLLLLIDWCKEIGFDVIQLLPLNDLGRGSSPYSAISAMALNPLNIGLAHLPEANSDPELKQQLTLLQELNKKNRVNYDHVISGKDRFLQLYFKKFGKTVLKSSDYEAFVQENPWLQSYGLFKALKIVNNWTQWPDWSKELVNISPEAYQKLLQQYSDAITYHSFIQFLCFRQLKEVHVKAFEEGISLMGDIPILISPDSADVWHLRHLFNLELSAGSPPDAFADGQNWGFPLYCWNEIEREHYKWWKERLSVCNSLYDIYRIDHIVGFYRIWAVPVGKAPTSGHFEPIDESKWISNGATIMHMMLNSSDMLPIGEDLGTVPPLVRVNMRSLGICGTRVIRWERAWEEDKRFYHIDEYIPESMTTVSTHDTETLQMWWQNPIDGAPEFAFFKGWSYNPLLTQEQRYSILYDSHHTTSLFHINLLGEYLAMVPMLTWPNPEDERINVPGVISEHNWTYRMRPLLENMMQNEELKSKMKSLIR